MRKIYFTKDYTPCPFKLTYKIKFIDVGHSTCIKCKYHKNIEWVNIFLCEGYVLCKHPLFNNKLKVVKGLIK